MRCPRKLYLVVSRKLNEDVLEEDVFVTRAEADEECQRRNLRSDYDDWRVEPYVKGD